MNFAYGHRELRSVDQIEYFGVTTDELVYLDHLGERRCQRVTVGAGKMAVGKIQNGGIQKGNLLGITRFFSSSRLLSFAPG